MRRYPEPVGPAAWALTPDGGPWRLTRTAAVALPAVGLALAAHALTGGCLPVGPTVAAAALGTAAGWAFAARERSGREVAGLLLLAQVAVHLLLWLTCSDGPGRTAGPTSGAAMAVAHLVAVGGAALVLHRAEAAVWLGARLGRAPGWALLLGRPAALPSAPPRLLPTTQVPRVRSASWASATPRRGPPVRRLSTP